METHFDDEFLKFDRVQHKRSQRADLHAFLVLDELSPGDQDIVAAAEHDEIWLDIDGNELEKLSDEQIRDLVRCGVRYDDEHDCLCMFV